MKKSDYSKNDAECCKSVLLDVISSIGKYRNDFVLVGGLVPKLICNNGDSHIGTRDVDFAVNSYNITEDVYSTIADMLFHRGYEYRKDSAGNDLKFSFVKNVEINGEHHKIGIDLIGPEYRNKSKKGFRDKIQDGVHVHKAHGVDILFDNRANVIEAEVTGILPDGIKQTERIKVAGGAAYIVLKLITFEERKGEKDAYDIYFCLKNYPGGIKALASEFQAIGKHGLAKEAFSILKERFDDINKIGPQRYARFLDLEPAERDAYAAEFCDLVIKLLQNI